MSVTTATIDKYNSIFDNKKDIVYIDSQRGAFIMRTLKAINILDSIIPISRFNKGEANKIFAEVKDKGIRIVVKNNVPECVLISPDEYQKMIEDYEDMKLLALAEKRLADDAAPISHKEMLKKMGFTESELDGIEVELE